jgi:hypothetical protein
MLLASWDLVRETLGLTYRGACALLLQRLGVGRVGLLGMGLNSADRLEDALGLSCFLLLA